MILDLLANRNTGSATFAPVAGVQSVPVVIGGGLPEVIEHRGSNKFFRAGDSFTVVSIGCAMPHGMVWGDWPAPVAGTNAIPGIRFLYYYRGAPGVLYQFPAFPAFGFSLPFPDYELSINVFQDAAALVTPHSDFCFVASFDPGGVLPTVSMVNLPPILAGTIQYIPCFVKVIHNFPLLP